LKNGSMSLSRVATQNPHPAYPAHRRSAGQTSLRPLVGQQHMPEKRINVASSPWARCSTSSYDMPDIGAQCTKTFLLSNIAYDQSMISSGHCAQNEKVRHSRRVIPVWKSSAPT
jgi:hypothetical protein